MKRTTSVFVLVAALLAMTVAVEAVKHKQERGVVSPNPTVSSQPRSATPTATPPLPSPSVTPSVTPPPGKIAQSGSAISLVIKLLPESVEEDGGFAPVDELRYLFATYLNVQVSSIVVTRFSIREASVLICDGQGDADKMIEDINDDGDFFVGTILEGARVLGVVYGVQCAVGPQVLPPGQVDYTVPDASPQEPLSPVRFVELTSASSLPFDVPATLALLVAVTLVFSLLF
eukprot:TRINITY_DN3833_c0_g1_i1.p1 TRINITY_DN3833_c0_g1~~TRINITY_DN3833_c0_g1_i1.p1  ORF type:complete len:240 (-),score=96.87 TRINITY_DN3833_c0_g1_i1:48-740(-)